MKSGHLVLRAGISVVLGLALCFSMVPIRVLEAGADPGTEAATEEEGGGICRADPDR